MKKKSSTILYIPHGGGPLPLLNHDGHSELVSGLQELAASIDRPEAIVIFSAHWERDRVGITGGEAPGLLYDYGGFPEESYSIQYPAAGNPDLAKTLSEGLNSSSIPAELILDRGLDHGVFVPLKLMFPDGDIPCIQVSLLKSLDASQHIALGSGLRGFEQYSGNILFLGSGFSFHNMNAFFSPDTADSRRRNREFEAWLNDTCTSRAMTEDQRRLRLANWHQAPSARYCHPREEHLLPLHVCYGLAETYAQESFTWTVMGKEASVFLWR